MPDSSLSDELLPEGHDLDTLSDVLYSAVVSDSCDRAGLRHQVAEPGLHGATQTLPVLVGWARTVQARPVAEAPARHYGAEIDFVDSLRTGDVVLADTTAAYSGFWGELFSTAATGRGARGAVIDGMVRDHVKMTALGFKIYARGAHPSDSLGRLSIVEQDHALRFRGVAARSGDFVIADVDGVVIVPRDRVREVLSYAVEKATIEDRARELLIQGGKLADVWEKFRVL